MRSPSTGVVLVLCLLLGLALTGPTSACGAKPTFDTPKAQVIYTVDQVVLRINELQNAAINANGAGAISEVTTRMIVQWCVATNRTLAHAPDGWHALAATSWDQLKRQLGPQPNPALTAAMGLVDVVLDLTPGVPR